MSASAWLYKSAGLLAVLFLFSGCGGSQTESAPPASGATAAPAGDDAASAGTDAAEPSDDAATETAAPSADETGTAEADASSEEPAASADEAAAKEKGDEGPSDDDAGADAADDAGADAAANEAASAQTLAELSALGNAVAEAGPDAGGSSRGKKTAADPSAARLKDPRNMVARVLQVKHGRFPFAAVRIAVVQKAKKGAGSKVKKNAKLVLLPQLQMQGREATMDDSETSLNAGAYYLRPGDRVAVRLGERAGESWKAEYIERR